MPEDKTLVCRDCKQNFIFSVREQEFFAEKGFGAPTRCVPCRRAHKAKRQADQGQPGAPAETAPRTGDLRGEPRAGARDFRGGEARGDSRGGDATSGGWRGDDRRRPGDGPAPGPRPDRFPADPGFPSRERHNPFPPVEVEAREPVRVPFDPAAEGGWEEEGRGKKKKRDRSARPRGEEFGWEDEDY